MGLPAASRDTKKSFATNATEIPDPISSPLKFEIIWTCFISPKATQPRSIGKLYSGIFINLALRVTRLGKEGALVRRRLNQHRTPPARLTPAREEREPSFRPPCCDRITGVILSPVRREGERSAGKLLGTQG